MISSPAEIMTNNVDLTKSVPKNAYRNMNDGTFFGGWLVSRRFSIINIETKSYNHFSLLLRIS